jgi:hypothetical protein
VTAWKRTARRALVANFAPLRKPITLLRGAWNQQALCCAEIRPPALPAAALARASPWLRARRGDRLATQSGCKRRRLKPIPLVITHTQPFGRRLAFCSMSKDEGRAITLNVPTMFTDQYLNERGEPAGHDSGLAA